MPSSRPSWQEGGGRPYAIADTEVWDVPDPLSGRLYQLFIGLPPSYSDQSGRRYPVLYVTDADYGFPVLMRIGHRLNVEGPAVEEFLLVGLSYAKGDTGMASRRRDYTPTSGGSPDAPPGAVHGGGAAYMRYLHEQVLPWVATRYRTDEERRLFLGHSYGGLLGMQILFSQPDMFTGYVIGSPSLWYDDHEMVRREIAYAAAHRDLRAQVYMYVGEREVAGGGDPRRPNRYGMVADMLAMRRALDGRRYPSLRLRAEVLEDEDHLSVAPRGFTRGLKYLLPD
ncbi:alpha/beta hydrolase [Rhizosaccharibacter radicis]|uniref:Alpha/beta hydrolase-fold protein n=1 Tax=Rhizosaccharibacter radicis TaxID=2782605 RepID=A0ABT1VXK0_9PROT|nr:alpha/beta hydrolase-fold protein [Acetobacteraceae bacterium KSS12]